MEEVWACPKDCVTVTRFGCGAMYKGENDVEQKTNIDKSCYGNAGSCYVRLYNDKRQ